MGKTTGTELNSFNGTPEDRWCTLMIPLFFSSSLMVFKLSEALGLSFSSADELNAIIDKKLPDGLPKFVREEVKLDGQTYEFYYRDIMQCIRVLYGDPELAEFLVHAPEKHFTGPDKKTRIYSEMHTGKWWWARQVCLFVHLSGGRKYLTLRHRKNLRRNSQG